MERLISQLPLFTLASSLAALPKLSRARCRHPLLLRAVSGEEVLLKQLQFITIS
uniref:Uncharacterized protein n=1 Tax=Oryza glumipatula TaxID=40148 RepID=A0A0E0AP22_9ORYZ